jgi:catechol 2,3-dioxygenase
MAPQLGHLNLAVSNLDEAVEFYRSVGFDVVRRAPRSPIAFLALDQPGAFQLGLSVAEEEQGLDHFALAYGSLKELAGACKALVDAGVEVVDAHHFGVSASVYFSDPDGNRFELYYEYPASDWPPEDERFRMRPLDLTELFVHLNA